MNGKRMGLRFVAAVAAVAAWLGCSQGGQTVADGGGATGVVGLTGIVLTEEGKPAAGVEAILLRQDYLKDLPPGALAKAGSVPTQTITITDAQGRFRFDGIDTGGYSLELKSGATLTQAMGAWHLVHADGSRRMVELSAIALAPLGSIRGILAGPGGVPARGFIQIFGLDRLTPCDSTGRFGFADLPPGRFRMRALPLGEALLPTISEAVAVASGEDRDVGNIPLASRSLALDGFEADSIRTVAYPGAPDMLSPLWIMGQPEIDSAPAIFTGDFHAGTRSLRALFGTDTSLLHFRPSGGIPNAWFPVHDYLLEPAKWQANTYDRLRFWIKTPPELPKAPPGYKNLEVGCYIRKSDGDPSTHSDGGGLWHHQFNIPNTGVWHQVILDTHPGHKSGTAGEVESGDLPHPTGESGLNYFDLATGYYVNFTGMESFPAAVLFDGFEVFRAHEDENTAQVYSLNGCFVPATQEIFVGWNRNKDESAPHEVRYAFRSVHATGWDAASPAPGGTVTPPAAKGFNGMEWSSRTINVTGYKSIFVAVRPTGSRAFREIEIALKP